MKKIFLILIFIAACASKKTNQRSVGHHELYSLPNKPEATELASDEQKIIIASTNDLHGNFDPLTFSFKDLHHKDDQNVKIGGEKVINQYFNILKENYSNVVLVDSGDLFSESMDIERIKHFYESNQYDAITLGLNDFNLKPPPGFKSNLSLIRKFAAKIEVPIITSNIYDLKTARNLEWKGTQSHLLKDLNGIKVGFIGLAPDDTKEKTSINKRVGLYIEDMLLSTMKHARTLRGIGADIIIVMTNMGLDCESKLSKELNLPRSKVNFNPKAQNVCDTNNLLGQYIEKLPPDLVDVIIGGRTHKKIANYVNGVILMAGLADSQSFNHVEIVFNNITRKINHQKTIIHQPVYFCHEFFKKTNDCYFEDQTINHIKKVPAFFLGKMINPPQPI